MVNGEVVERNSERNEDITRLDLRLTKGFNFGDWTIDVFGEVFNVFNEHGFEVGTGFGNIAQRDPTDDEFGIASNLVTDQRQFQFGVRLSFR